jgi:hypothetical protein
VTTTTAALLSWRWRPWSKQCASTLLRGPASSARGTGSPATSWLLPPAGPRLARVRVWAVGWPLAGLALTVAGDMHGPPLLLGFGLGALLLWRDRRLSPVAASRHPSFQPAGEQSWALASKTHHRRRGIL